MARRKRRRKLKNGSCGNQQGLQVVQGLNQSTETGVSGHGVGTLARGAIGTVLGGAGLVSSVFAGDILYGNTTEAPSVATTVTSPLTNDVVTNLTEGMSTTMNSLTSSLSNLTSGVLNATLEGIYSTVSGLNSTSVSGYSSTYVTTPGTTSAPGGDDWVPWFVLAGCGLGLSALALGLYDSYKQGDCTKPEGPGELSDEVELQEVLATDGRGGGDEDRDPDEGPSNRQDLEGSGEDLSNEKDNEGPGKNPVSDDKRDGERPSVKETLQKGRDGKGSGGKHTSKKRSLELVR